MKSYLKLPIRFEDYFENHSLATCNLRESVIRHLHLLITTGLEENKQDWEYGCVFWDYDYDIHLSADANRQLIISSIKKQITTYEKRLADVSVEVNVKQAEYSIHSTNQLKRRIEIIVTGSLIQNNEPFQFQTAFFIGPMLFD